MEKQKNKSLKIGSTAPDFKLPDQTGKKRKLSDYKGKWVLLYFYPKDDTPGCTIEAKTFEENISEFKKKKVVVLGVSVDSVKSHDKFCKKYDLSFVLLSDEDKKAVNLYGVWAKKKFMGREYMGTLRTSFLINPEGKIVKIYKNVKPPVHAEEVLRDLKEFQKSRS